MRPADLFQPRPIHARWINIRTEPNFILPDSQLIERIDRIRVWQEGDRRAVHKPLLVLLMLGKLARGEAVARFGDIEDDFCKLREQFGPAG